MFKKPAILGGIPAFEDFLPLIRPTIPKTKNLILNEVNDVLNSGMLTKGKYLKEFENNLKDYIGVSHAVAVSSCTLGLMLTYHGLKFKNQVIVPSFTFMATVHPLVWVGATPVFVDIDPETWNIDPQKIEEAITDKTYAIVAVHNFGNPAPIDELLNIANKYNLKLVFDAAHGFGSKYKEKQVGGFGDAEVFSSSPTKLLVTGEGGVVTTNNEKLAEHIILGREYGNAGDYNSAFPGLNARMQEFSAIMGIHSLRELEDNATRRNKVAQRFISNLKEIPGVSFQKVDPENQSSYKDFSILINPEEFGLNRDQLAIALKAENIDTRKYHYPPVHMHKAYEHLADKYKGKLTVTEYISKNILSLPIWSHMDYKIVDKISEAILRIFKYKEEVKKAIAG